MSCFFYSEIPYETKDISIINTTPAEAKTEVSEIDVMVNLLKIEESYYCENVWYWSIEESLKNHEMRGKYPIVEEYVKRRNYQWYGRDFSHDESNILTSSSIFNIYVV